MDNLQLRLRNCIQTILELEPAINASNGVYFQDELSSLKRYLGCINTMSLAEDDVRQLEKTASEFLASVKCICLNNLNKKHILQ